MELVLGISFLIRSRGRYIVFFVGMVYRITKNIKEIKIDFYQKSIHIRLIVLVTWFILFFLNKPYHTHINKYRNTDTEKKYRQSKHKV